jgi:hypothetical protein
LLLSNASLYVGGAFNTYRGQVVGNLVKVSVSTGAIDAAFNQGLGIYGDIVRTLTMNRTSLYCGGSFRTYRSETTLPAIKVDATSGVRDGGFNPVFTFINYVSVLTSVGDQIAVAGDFAAVPMMVDTQTGAPNPVSGTRTAGGTVRDMVADGSSLFVAGQFSAYGAVRLTTPTNGLVKINPLTGELDANFLWGNTGIQGFSSMDVRSIGVDGASIFAGSQFVSAQGNIEFGVVKLDKTTGTLVPGFSNLLRSPGQVEKVVPTPTAIWVGGDFLSLGNKKAYYFVPLNPLTGELLDP